ncbi:MAG: creatininase family protein [Firmicutes bacterium]|nr:creatininase family protein [Bacillota bacterium]
MDVSTWMSLASDRYLPLMTWQRVAALSRDSLFVLPIGSVEQHGPHLPLLTDTLTVVHTLEAALHQLPKERPVYALPPIAYANSIEHAAFPGTLTIDGETLQKTVMGIGESLARSGFHKLLLLNGHGGNTAILKETARRLHLSSGLVVFSIACGSLWEVDPNELSEEEARLGLHAGQVETSIAMAAFPEWVGELPQAMLPPEDAWIGPEHAPVTYAWASTDWSESGVLGDPSQASLEMGRRWFNHGVQRLAECLSACLSWDPSRSSNRLIEKGGA